MGNDLEAIRVTVELDAVRVTLMRAIDTKLGDIGHQFQHAIDAACSPEAVQKVLCEAASKYLREAIDVATKDFLLYGTGNQIVRAIVRDKLLAEVVEFAVPKE